MTRKSCASASHPTDNMAGQKRSRNGKVKPTASPQQEQTAGPVAGAIPPCAQPQIPSSTIEAQSISKTTTSSEVEETRAPKTNEPTQQPLGSKRPNRTHSKHNKLPKLPPNTTIYKRPLLHPQIPTPFASSSSPKTLYITASTSFVPALKRIRKLLAEISRREKQAHTALSKKHKAKGGKLSNGDVEMQIAADLAAQKAKGNASLEGAEEKVYLKATGRAIPRALELGVQFQGEESGEYVVKVEMGSVRAVDDVEVSGAPGEDGDGEEDIPETRMRNVSMVTVSIGMK
ncbi:Rpp20 subunit of nuclear RNase MRP and P-domain-containing protein [Phaeosphaeria sp. MPI-PUGE-AT-0046c]|nr:Rpp20 subunit of nuclear RNase MRP and P-domain-containing protein [Phaeosphaeria sp. MPI-PUGE-AT-0046c]